jgi:hypothetical protein
MSDEFIINPSRMNGYPSFDFLPSEFNEISMTSKYFLKINNDYLNGYPSFLKNFPPTQTPPYPRYLLSCEDDYLNGYPSFRKECITFGAFQFAKMLNNIVIPRTVKFISDYTFYGTNLKKVTIAPDCKYFEHSFPKECQIEFYED